MVGAVTNNQAMAYATVAINNIYKGKISDTKLREIIQKIREEMYWQFDVLTEDEAEKVADKIKRK